MSAINDEKVKNRLDEILKNIQTEADPHLLNQYRSLIRKKVSFFQRSYLAAYLLMLQDQAGGGRSRDMQRSSPRKSGGGEPPRTRSNNTRDNTRGSEPSEGAEQNRQPLPSALPEDESTRLFISVGRNRRVFPREILGLIGTKTSVSKDDIGIINILNNYSFVQVRNSVAEEIIEALNGINFRGRTLAVNYARSRKEEDGDSLAAPLEGLPGDNNDDTDSYSDFDDSSTADPETDADSKED
ncbi:DbpA RNA binding domain-containing protein [Treponema primitia]|uniref:DbpA RNA binding domain-containing protein n=1 Tax=Treponema primitia TaxID=88058 RepID=UPI0002554E00|nr:DbpA RNA binding domain-containing protein [Treponema primitia]